MACESRGGGSQQHIPIIELTAQWVQLSSKEFSASLPTDVIDEVRTLEVPVWLQMMP